MNLRDFARSQIASLCPELISEDSFAQLLEFSNFLPRTVFSEVLSFEFVGNEPVDHTDFGFHLSFTKHSIQELQESFDSVATELRANKHWANFFGFLKALKDENPHRKIIRSLWLVFDFNPSSVNKPVWPPDPSIYFFFKSHHDVHHVENLRGFFTSKKMSLPAMALLKKCYESCTSLNLQIANVGILCARSLDWIRLYIEGETMKNNIGHYLSLIGYPYDPHPLLDILNILTPYFEKMNLGFDIGISIGDRIGVECYLPYSLDFPEKKAVWEEVLSILCSLNMLPVEKKNALINWMHLQMTRGYGSLSEDLLLRAINHIKLIYSKDEKVSAKVYLMPRLPGISSVDLVKSAESI